MKIAVVSTKGGTGKTTTAVYLACGFHQLGRTLLIDADPQQSALLWSKQDPIFPLTVISLPVSDLHRRLPGLARGYAHVIIDTPPGDIPVIRSAVLAADTVLVPVAPAALDINRLAPTFDLLAALEPVHAVDVGVLLVKVRARTVTARTVRDVLTGHGWPVMDTEIPLRESYAAAFGTAPADLAAYGGLLKELNP